VRDRTPFEFSSARDSVGYANVDICVCDIVIRVCWCSAQWACAMLGLTSACVTCDALLSAGWVRARDASVSMCVRVCSSWVHQRACVTRDKASKNYS